jgi:hypothetical protein
MHGWVLVLALLNLVLANAIVWLMAAVGSDLDHCRLYRRLVQRLVAVGGDEDGISRRLPPTPGTERGSGPVLATGPLRGGGWWQMPNIVSDERPVSRSPLAVDHRAAQKRW